MLIISAHCDDIELALGSAIPNIKEPITALILTHSGYSAKNTFRGTATAREESRQSLKRLGITDIHFGEYETGQLVCNFDTVGYAERLLTGDSVLTHWHGDHHQDHRACFEIALAAARRCSSLYGFASGVVTTTTAHPFTPNCFISCTEADVEEQIECCKLHKSEWEKFEKSGNIADILRARAVYYGSLCGKPYATGLVQYRGML